MRELPGLLQGQLDLTAHVREQRLDRVGIGIHKVARKLKVDRERHQVLLWTVVELALDPAPGSVLGDGEPFTRSAQLLDLDAQPVERLLRCLDMRTLRESTSCFEGYRELSVMEPAPSRGLAPHMNGVAACLRNRLSPP
jgi:hypothetical protein